ncbi:MAG: hypothetical protein RJB02_1696, partial [Pseudomonadota bacterium]
RLGIKTHILRYWEEQFPMLRPLKRAGGRRLYRPDDVVLVERIRDLLDRQGYTIKGARSFLTSGAPTIGVQAVATPSPEARTDLFMPKVDAGLQAELSAIRATLARALADA